MPAEPSANPVAALDEYELRHLPEHLVDAGRAADLHKLLRLEWIEEMRRNAWYEAKDAVGDPAGYLTDVALARRLADEDGAAEVARGEPAASIATALRYALMTTSIRSVAGSIPPVLLVALVRTGCWTAEKGVAYARQDPSTYDRARALTRLVPFAPESLLEAVAREALSAVREISGTEQAELLAEMFPDLPDPVLGDAVAVTRAIAAPPTDEATTKVRDAWLALVSRLPVPDALAAAREYVPDWARPEALACAAARAEEPLRTEALDEALDEALAGNDDLGIATNLGQMAPYLTDRAQARALEAVARLDDFNQRLAIEGMAPFLLAPEAAERAAELASALEDASEALAPIATQLSGGRREQVLGQALAAARAVSDDWARAHRIAALGAHLTEPLLEEAVGDALAIDEPGTRALALAALVGRLPATSQQSGMRAALAATLAIDDEEQRAWFLALVVPHLSPPLKRAALEATRALADEAHRTRVLEALLPVLPDAEALDAALELEDEDQRARALAALSGESATELLAAAIDAALDLSDWRARADALAGLIPHVGPELALHVLARVRATEDGAKRAAALAILAGLCGEPRRSELLACALDVARRLRDPADRMLAKAVVASRQHEPAATDLFREALAESREIDNEHVLSRTLDVVAQHLPPALEIPRSLPVANAAAIGRLAEPRRREALEEALDAAVEIEEVSARQVALSSIASLLPEDLAERAYEAAKTIDHDDFRAAALESLAPRLPMRLVREALSLADAMPSDMGAHAVATLLPRLPRDEAVPAAATLASGPDRAKALLALAPGMSEAELADVLPAARTIEQPVWRARVLFALRPAAPEPLARDMLDEAIEAVNLIEFEEPRETFEGAASQLLELPAAALLGVWQRIFASLERHSRADVLGGVAVLAPALAKLGGPEAVHESARALQDVGAWWP